MVGFRHRLNLLNIIEAPLKTIGVYAPVVDDQTHAYGIGESEWPLWAECKAWWSDSSIAGYDSATGVSADTTTTIYIAADDRRAPAMNNVPLPSRVGIKLNEMDTQLKPSRSVENFYDFDSSYAYSVVVI